MMVPFHHIHEWKSNELTKPPAVKVHYITFAISLIISSDFYYYYYYYFSVLLVK